VTAAGASPSLAPAGAVATRLERITAVARAKDVGALFLSGPATVRWAGIPSPRGVALVAGSGAAIAVAPAGFALPPGLASELFDPGRPGAGAEALARALDYAGLGHGDPIGVEGAELPAGLLDGLGGRPRVDVTDLLDLARATKDADEIALIEAACGLVGAGHAAVRSALEPGVTELELWGAAERAMAAVAGAGVEAAVDLMAGPRTELVGVPPGDFAVAAGAGVLFDLAPCHGGYWADSCATFACGEPAPALARRHAAVCRALDAGIAAARPGVQAGSVDRAIRTALEATGLECPHHTGHGVGTAQQEAPWLVPGAETELQEGAVIALEPGAYADGFGVRLEHLLVVEAGGARPLTFHSLDIT
jgi:Xaa-Pro aminopeptidase